MSELDREAIVREMGRLRVSAILRTHDAGTARRAMQAAVAGGFRMIEFTFSVPDVLDLVAEFAQDERLTVGAGTVLTAGQARDAVAAGARFLVSPVVDDEVIREARSLGAASVPGTATPTEMLRAHRAGADVLKVFPAPADIPAFVQQIRGPFPEFRLFPTAGVGERNFMEILDRGAYGVGFVASLFPPDLLARGEVSGIEAAARRIHARLADTA